MANKRVKVPVIMQMEALECGAASLAMILAYHGKWVPLEQVREDCGVSRDGSNCKSMMLAARSYGLIANGYKCGVEDVKEVDFPAIIHWNFNHFVVLDGFKKDKAIINDPARGTVEVDMKEFDESFTGVVLCFEEGEGFERGGKPKSVVEFARKRLKGTFAPFMFVILTGALTSLLGVIQPGFSRVFTDRLLTGQNLEWLYPFLILFSCLVGFQLIVSILNTVYMLKIRGKLAIVSNSSFMWHVLRLPMNFFSQRQVGDIVSRQSSNESIAETLISQLAPVALNIAMLVFYLVMILKYSIFLSLIGIATVFINMMISNYISQKRVNISRAQTRDSGKLYSTTMSGIEMVETIKSSGAENGFFEKWSGYHASVNTSVVNGAKMNQYLGSLPGIIQSLTNALILGVGITFIISGHDNFSVGKLFAFQGFMGSFLAPVNSLIGVGQSVQEMKTSMERIEDVMTYEPDVVYNDTEEKKDIEYSKLSGAMKMEGVTFGYNKLAAPLVENFHLELKPGSRVAFVGSSGCGKSTLAKLISGLYKPWSGSITFDGKPISGIPREIFTGSLAVVDQDITIFEDSISENIKMWDNSIEDFEMILAARDAQIHNDIMLRDGGYNCKMLEGGKNLSGGQRQRIEIARVLAQDPSLIILDEATSALDAKTEYDVMEAIRKRGITCIMVAHRLSTIRDCDEIIVMDKGKVIERGKHEDLYAAGGMYTQLIATE